MDPEALYQEVLKEEQGKGVSPAVAEGRAKAARVRAEQGSPHPKEPKWWPGAQPHLEGGEPAVAEEEAAEEAAAPEPAAEEAPAPEPAAEEAPAPEPVAEAPAPEPAPEPPTQPAEAPAVPAAATAPEPAAAVATATPTQLPPDQRPSGVTHGQPSGNRLRPEDAVGTEAQFDAQRAVHERRKLIDELVASGVPAVSVSDAARPRSSPLVLLLYLLIPAIAIAALVGQQDTLSEETPPPNNRPPAAGEIEISAQGVAFDTDAIELPAGEESTIHFLNEDSVQHNVAIYVEEGGEALFEGQIIPGGSEVTYEVPALDEGENYFQCDVHPSMNGTVTVQ